MWLIVPAGFWATRREFCHRDNQSKMKSSSCAFIMWCQIVGGYSGPWGSFQGRSRVILQPRGMLAISRARSVGYQSTLGPSNLESPRQSEKGKQKVKEWVTGKPALPVKEQRVDDSSVVLTVIGCTGLPGIAPARQKSCSELPPARMSSSTIYLHGPLQVHHLSLINPLLTVKVVYFSFPLWPLALPLCSSSCFCPTHYAGQLLAPCWVLATRPSLTSCSSSVRTAHLAVHKLLYSFSVSPFVFFFIFQLSAEGQNLYLNSLSPQHHAMVGTENSVGCHLGTRRR